MSSADRTVSRWLDSQIDTGRRLIAVTTELLEHDTTEGLIEVRRVATFCCMESSVSASAPAQPWWRQP